MTVFSPFRLKQRAVAVQFILLGAFVVILGAFFRAQVIEHDDFQQRAENNRLRRLNLAGFPYGVFYFVSGVKVHIPAVMHAAREHRTALKQRLPES